MPPHFFIPNVAPAEQEAAYTAFAGLVQVEPAPIGSRIYSITYRHDGAMWTATVGEQLRGHTIANPSDRAKSRRTERPLGDPAMVLAILASVPYFVFTDGGHAASGRSAWTNPFMAGEPNSVTSFATGE